MQWCGTTWQAFPFKRKFYYDYQTFWINQLLFFIIISLSMIACHFLAEFLLIDFTLNFYLMIPMYLFYNALLIDNQACLYLWDLHSTTRINGAIDWTNTYMHNKYLYRMFGIWYKNKCVKYQVNVLKFLRLDFVKVTVSTAYRNDPKFSDRYYLIPIW